MKKSIVVICLIISLLTLTACGEHAVGEHDENSNSITENSSSVDIENLSMWQMAGKGVGKILPEPELKYSLSQSSSFIAAEIENATYDFFEDYVNQCIKAGFNGSIGTAESPDYYFNGETTNGERVQVMFYETENKVSISAFPAK
ncbi:MAG: hypothetical protein IIW63_01120 [Clostridia bacterium]|nr:hypothetical protein [Clostridia bacterium]